MYRADSGYEEDLGEAGGHVCVGRGGAGVPGKAGAGLVMDKQEALGFADPPLHVSG